MHQCPGLKRFLRCPRNLEWQKIKFGISALSQKKEEMDDAISRVAYDPIRKLGRYDRLIGNAEFCMKYGIIPEALTTAAACALAYDEPNDPNAQKLQALIKEKRY